MDNPIRWLKLASQLALRGYGLTSPNPMVGAVLIKHNNIIGYGWHKGAGLPHAEVEAIKDAESKGYTVEGATLFVSLEPCSTWGRTPPCTDLIVKKKISQVYIAALDPNPAHQGRAIEILKKAGIKPHLIELPFAQRLIIGFDHWIRYKEPWIIIKFASSLDARIATSKGNSRWITNSRSRATAIRLRQGVDAILVGVNTVIADDPELTIRWGNKYWPRQPLRVVLDPHARIPQRAKLLNDRYRNNTLLILSEMAPVEKVKKLSELCEVLILPYTPEKGIDLKALSIELGHRQVTRLLVEGGGKTIASFINQGYIHEACFFIAPILIGGKSAPRNIDKINLQKPLQLNILQTKILEGDLYIRAFPNYLI